MKGELAGVYVILVTPLDEERRLDIASLENLVDYYLKSGVDGLTVLGEVSETGRLTGGEQEQIVETVVRRVRDRVPIVFGISRESTDQVIEAARWAEGSGAAAALMVAPPKNLNLREDDIFKHFQALGRETKRPIVVQDEPESNHPRMSVELLAKICDQVPNARYVKLEDSPTPAKIEKLRKLVGDKASIFAASHGRWYLWEIDCGAAGIMTGSPTPEYLVETWKAYKEAGDRDKAKQIFFHNLPLTYVYGEMAIAVKKEVLVRRGVIKTALMKQPAAEFGDLERSQLAETLDWVEERMSASTGVQPLSWRGLRGG